MYDLTGKVALVTGAASKLGFGRAIANRLAREGADVVVVDRIAVLPHDEGSGGDWKGLDSIVDEIKALGRRALAATCDISKSEEVDEMVNKAVTGLGKVDILVNNAGVHMYSGLLKHSDEVWNKILAVNLTGTFYCARAVARQMVQRGEGGRIINVGSLWSKVALSGGQAAYCASKFGVIGLTQSLALELAPHNILVNTVCPALTDTNLHSRDFKADAEREGINEQEVRNRMHEPIAARVPLGRLGTTEDLANMVAFLASDEASFITGQSINVNGGLFTAL